LTRLRQLMTRYPIATVAVSAVLLAFVAWQIYHAVAPAPAQVQLAAVVPGPTTAPPATGSSPAAPGGGGLAGAGGAGLKPAPTTGGQSGASMPPAEGRPDPFVSLVQPPGGGSAGSPVRGVPLPPVPPLAPGALGPGGVPMPPGGPAGPSYRVAGIIRDTVALAIVEDGVRSHIVEPGDILGPGVRVVAIDARRGVVELMQDGVPVELRLAAAGGKVP